MRLAPLLYCSVLSLSGVLLSACGGGDSATDTNSGAQGGQSGGGGVAGKAGSGGSGSGQSGGGGSSGGGAGKAGGAGVAGSAGASGSAGAGGAGSAGKGGVSGSSGQGGSAGEAGAGAVSGSGGAGNGGSAGASAGSAGSGVVQGGSAGDSGAGGGGGGGSAGAAGAAGDAGSAGAAGDAGAAGSAGSGGCAVDNDCAAQLPATLDPPGCADALCEAGVCVLRPKDADGDGKRGKLCADTGGAVVLPGDDCDDSDSKRFPGAWDGPAGEGHEGSCDGVDNNCSGAPDDTALSDGTSCECKLGTSSSCSEDEAGNLITWPAGDPVGACSYGTKDCLPDPSTGLGKWTACFGAVSPVNEVCDGLDNDCNGAVDDGLGTVNCGVGGCGKTVDACVNGQLSECVPGEPGPEVCDGVDNDCNGLVDEDNPGGGVDCSTGKLGVCSSGVALCENGALKCIQSVEPSDEVCDGLDNNCDGKTDENNPGGGDCDTGKLGACAPGALQCVSGALFCLQKQPSTSEDCDGIDNNCDGNVDEDNPGGGVQCLTGLLGQCAVGVKQCQGGALNCVAPQPTAEICNGLDDNCDGNIDETCTACDFADINKSSIGCLYYALDANNDPVEGYDAQPYAVTVSNVDSVAVAKVKVQTRNNGVWTDIQTATVNPSSLHQFNLPDRHVNYTNLNPAGAYRVVSDSPIVAYQFQPVNGQSSFTSDASLLLPRSALDTSYIVAGWGKPSFGNAQMVVIATEDNTSVTVTPTTPIIAGGSIPAINANTPYTRSLNAGDYMQLESSTGSFSGTTVKSTKPVSVFSNHWCANIPTQVCCCDHLEEQIFGLQTWGKTYVASRHPRRNTSGGAEAVLWQVVASEDNTTVSFAATAGVTGLPAGPQVLNKGQTLQLLVGGPSATNPGDFIATGDKPILVVQYMTSSQNSNAPVAQAGDPFMVQAVPSEQYLDNYVVLTPSQWNLDYLILTKPVGSSITVDGVAVPQAQFSPVGNSTWEVARVLSSDGVHRLKGTAPFGVLVVGYDSYDSYGYPGGLNQLVINPQQLDPCSCHGGAAVLLRAFFACLAVFIRARGSRTGAARGPWVPRSRPPGIPRRPPGLKGVRRFRTGADRSGASPMSPQARRLRRRTRGARNETDLTVHAGQDSDRPPRDVKPPPIASPREGPPPIASPPREGPPPIASPPREGPPPIASPPREGPPPIASPPREGRRGDRRSPLSVSLRFVSCISPSPSAHSGKPPGPQATVG